MHHTVVSLMKKVSLKAAYWLDLDNPFLLEDINQEFESF